MSDVEANKKAKRALLDTISSDENTEPTRNTSSGAEGSAEENSAEEGAITSARIMEASMRLMEMAKLDSFPRKRSNFKKKKPAQKKFSSDSTTTSDNSDAVSFYSDSSASKENPIHAKRQSEFRDVATETSADYHNTVYCQIGGFLGNSAKEENVVPYKIDKYSSATHLDCVKTAQGEIASEVGLAHSSEHLLTVSDQALYENKDTMAKTKKTIQTGKKRKGKAVSQTVSINEFEKTKNDTVVSAKSFDCKSVVDMSKENVIDAFVELPTSSKAADKVATKKFTENKKTSGETEGNKIQPTKLNASTNIGDTDDKTESNKGLFGKRTISTKSKVTDKSTNKLHTFNKAADKVATGKFTEDKKTSGEYEGNKIQPTKLNASTNIGDNKTKSNKGLFDKKIKLTDKSTNNSKTTDSMKSTATDKLTEGKNLSVKIKVKKIQPTKLNASTNIEAADDKTESNKEVLGKKPKSKNTDDYNITPGLKNKCTPKSSDSGKSGSHIKTPDSNTKASDSNDATSTASDKLSTEDKAESGAFEKSGTHIQTLDSNMKSSSSKSSSAELNKISSSNDTTRTDVFDKNKSGTTSSSSKISFTGLGEISTPVNAVKSDHSDKCNTQMKNPDSESKISTKAELENVSTYVSSATSQNTNDLDSKIESIEESVIPKKSKKSKNKKKTKKSKKNAKNDESLTNTDAGVETASIVKTSSKKTRLNAKRRAAKRKAATNLAAVTVNVGDGQNNTVESNLISAKGNPSTSMNVLINSRKKPATSNASTSCENISTASGEISLVYTPGIFTNLKKIKLPTIPEISTEQCLLNVPTTNESPSTSNFDLPSTSNISTLSSSKPSSSDIGNNKSTYNYGNPVVKLVCKRNALCQIDNMRNHMPFRDLCNTSNIAPNNLAPINEASTSSFPMSSASSVSVLFGNMNKTSFKPTLKRKAPSDEIPSNITFETNRDMSITSNSNVTQFVAMPSISGIPLPAVAKTLKTNVKRRLKGTGKNTQGFGFNQGLTENIISTTLPHDSKMAVIAVNDESVPNILIENSNTLTDFSDIIPSIGIIDSEESIELYKENDVKNISFKEVDTTIESETNVDIDIDNYSAETDTVASSVIVLNPNVPNYFEELKTTTNISDAENTPSKVIDYNNKQAYQGVIPETDSKAKDTTSARASLEAYTELEDLTSSTAKTSASEPLSVIYYIPSRCEIADLPTESANTSNIQHINASLYPDSSIPIIKDTNKDNENVNTDSKNNEPLTISDTKPDLTKSALKEEKDISTYNISVKSVSSINNSVSTSQQSVDTINLSNKTDNIPDCAFPPTSNSETFNDASTFGILDKARISGTSDEAYSIGNTFVAKSESAAEVKLLKRARKKRTANRRKRMAAKKQLNKEHNKGDPATEYQDDIDLD